MSYILGAIAIAGAIGSTMSRRGSNKSQAIIEANQAEINKQTVIGESYTEAYNMIEDLAVIENSNQAMASAMGKSIESASVENINSTNRGLLDRDISRSLERARITGQSYDLAGAGAMSSARRKNSALMWSLGSNLTSIASKGF